LTVTLQNLLLTVQLTRQVATPERLPGSKLVAAADLEPNNARAVGRIGRRLAGSGGGWQDRVNRRTAWGERFELTDKLTRQVATPERLPDRKLVLKMPR